MTNQELKEALLQRCPVVCRGITYAYISGIIYRCIGGKIKVSVELMSDTANSITIADSKFIEKEAGENARP